MIMIRPTISIHIHPCPKYTNKHWCIPMISKMYRNSQDQKIFRKSRRFQTSQARDALDWAPCGSAGLGAAPDGRGAQQPLACRAQHAAAPWSGGDAIGWRGAKEDVAWWTMGNPTVLAKVFIGTSWNYCGWWSEILVDGWNPINRGMFTIYQLVPSGAGFRNHPPYVTGVFRQAMSCQTINGQIRGEDER